MTREEYLFMSSRDLILRLTSRSAGVGISETLKQDPALREELFSRGLIKSTGRTGFAEWSPTDKARSVMQGEDDRPRWTRKSLIITIALLLVLGTVAVLLNAR